MVALVMCILAALVFFAIAAPFNLLAAAVLAVAGLVTLF